MNARSFVSPLFFRSMNIYLIVALIHEYNDLGGERRARVSHLRIVEMFLLVVVVFAFLLVLLHFLFLLISFYSNPSLCVFVFSKNTLVFTDF